MSKVKCQKSKVFMMLSGGVDSSVAALLLQKQSYDLVGCHIKCFNVDGCGEKDVEDARRIAEQLQIPFYVFDLEQEYKDKVVKYMVAGYKKGITPNPDVMCNSEIKFGLFLERALKLGADFVATGHYVRIGCQPRGSYFEKDGSARSSGSPSLISAARVSLKRNTKLERLPIHFSKQLRTAGTGENCYFLEVAKDKNKDQSYFLWRLTQEQLKHCLFPIGDYTKAEVRKIAQKYGLLTAEKKDSQGICFLGKVGLADFLKRYLPEKRGAVLDENGKKIGEHNGAQFYTIGQRHLGIADFKLQISDSSRRPFYVADKDIKKNTITVVEGDDHPLLYKKEITLTDVNLINYTSLRGGTADEVSLRDISRRETIFKIAAVASLLRDDKLAPHPRLKSGLAMTDKEILVLVRIRYRQPLQRAVLQLKCITSTGSANQLVPECSRGATLVFDKPQKAVALGQSAVFYDDKGKEMLGGGVIE